jgi:hypothetical protein
LVVLVAVLSVVLVALVVPFVASTENYQAQLREQTTLLRAAEAEATTAQAQVREQYTAAAAQREMLEMAAEGLSADLDATRAELASTETQLVEARANAQVQVAVNEALAQAVQQGQTRMDQMMAQVDSLRSQMLDVSADRNESDDTVAVLTGRNARLAEQLRRQTELLAAAEQEAQDLAQELIDLRPFVSGEGSAPPVASDRVSGEVVGVDSDRTPTLVQVNVGQRDGVRENMEFIISRDTQFLGTLIITTVDQREAVGTVQSPRGEIRSGDSVQTGI